MAGSTYRRLAVALLLAAGLLISPPTAAGGLIWDIGIVCGYASVVLVVCLFAYPLRGDGLSREHLLGLSQHRLLGWITLATAALHVAVLLGSQTLIGRYLLPSAPVFMWCGVVALILAAVLIRKTGRWHVPLAMLMALTVWAHLVGSGQALRGSWKFTIAGLLLVLPIAWYAFRGRGPSSRSRTIRRVCAAAAVVVIALLAVPTSSRLLLQPAARPSLAPILFPHENHTSVNCVVCHHNYIDHTGVVACVDCHRSARPDLVQTSEATFHTFCRDCHVQLANAGAKHGPTRECSACHR